MSIIVTPGPLEKRGEFYQQLGQLTAAGISLVNGLERLEQHPPSRADRAPLRQLLAQIQQGATFSEALRATGRWLPTFDIALLHAGEQSGRLPECFRLLSDHYRDRARLVRQVLADIAYPAIVLHLAIFIFPFPGLFLTGNLPVYLAKTVGVLAPLYLALLLVVIALQGRRGEMWRESMERLLHPIPLLGQARRALALARLSAALEALLGAGVTVIEAWDIAVLACGSPLLRRVVAGWEQPLRSGQTPGDLLDHSKAFPELFANLYRTGEVSGKLDESLRNLHHYYQEEGTRKLHLVAKWCPQLAYFGIMALIAWKVIQGWMAYFQQINDVIQ